jgi:5-(carboxyamino)imidazole ribonucleotide mutase
MIGIVMGSTSDWETMKAAAKVLEEFGVPYEAKAMSAHRTPHAVADWATKCPEERQEGDHCRRWRSCTPGRRSGRSHYAPGARRADAVQAPARPRFPAFDCADAEGHSGGHLRHREAGAGNAALFAVALLALSDAGMAKKLSDFRAKQTESVLKAAPLKL